MEGYYFRWTGYKRSRQGGEDPSSNYCQPAVLTSQCRITHAQWKVVQELDAAICEEHSYYSEQDFDSVARHDGTDGDDSFTERFAQVVRCSENFPYALADVEGPQRWLAVDVDHCGDKGEKVLFRTFVDAQLREQDVCQKSSTAPYMLLLWSRLESCELYLSLFNQHGTVRLVSNITFDHIQQYDNSIRSGTRLFFDFTARTITINFLC